MTATALAHGWARSGMTQWSDAQGVLEDEVGAVLGRSAVLNPPGAVIPPQAAAAGITTPLLTSTFTVLSRIDTGMTGAPGYDWYTKFTWTSDASFQQDPAQTLHIAQDADGSPYLRIAPDTNNCNWTISSMDMATQAGRIFTTGYFEVTARFATPQPVSDWGTVSWPSIWLASVRGMLGEASWAVSEIDVMEAMLGPGRWAGTLHEWPGLDPTLEWKNRYGSPSRSKDHYSAGFNAPMPDSATWHRYGVLWERPDAAGIGRCTWYLDDVQLATIAYGVGHTITRAGTPGANLTTRHETALNTFTPFTEVDAFPQDVGCRTSWDKMTLVIGTGKGNPMDVKQVRVLGY